MLISTLPYMCRFYSASSQLGSNRPSETQLVAHKSVPHDMDADAFLIPSADLMLHEQIGAGAEGKVSCV